MQATQPLFAERSWTSHDGLRLFARDYAAAGGPARCPVICIHGLTRNSADFDDVAPWIAALGRRVLAVDVRGRGRSQYDPDSSHYTPTVYARDIIDLAESLGIARAVFIGTSMGGIITMTLALKRSSLIAAAVLNDVGPFISQTGLNRIAGYVGQGQALASWDDAAAYSQRINGYAFPDYTMDDWMKWSRRTFTQDADGKFVLQYDPGIALAVRKGDIKTTSWIARLAFRRLASQRPTLLVRGALSDLVEAEQAERMRASAPTLQYCEVPGVGHAPMLMEPEAQSALRRFLGEVP